MVSSTKFRSLLQSAADLLQLELSVENKDSFTQSYLGKRLDELRSYLNDEEITKAHLESAKNIVTNISYAIDQNAGYDDPRAQFYKAVVSDLKDEFVAACDQ